jgi:hypothetical protein
MSRVADPFSPVVPTITARLGLSRAAVTGAEVTTDHTGTIIETERTPRSPSTTKTGNTRSS